MALITCLECGKVFSDKASVCPECGCPTEIANNYTYSIFINGIKQDATILYEALELYKKDEIDIRAMRSAYNKWDKEVCSYKMIPDDGLALRKYITDNKAIPERWECSSMSYEEWKKQVDDALANRHKPRCPKCGSTSITAGARGANALFGFMGASKTVNRCSNCGNTWTPKGK